MQNRSGRKNRRSRFWDSFREKRPESPTMAVAFFDLVCGRDPNWRRPTFMVAACCFPLRLMWLPRCRSLRQPATVFSSRHQLAWRTDLKGLAPAIGPVQNAAGRLFIRHQDIRKSGKQRAMQNRDLAAAAGSKNHTGNILQLAGRQGNDALVERMVNDFAGRIDPVQADVATAPLSSGWSLPHGDQANLRYRIGRSEFANEREAPGRL